MNRKRKYISVVVLTFSMIVFVIYGGSAGCGGELEPNQLHGIRFSPFRDGQSPATGEYPTRTQISRDLRKVKKLTNTIATYSVLRTLGSIPKLATQKGLNCYIGTWLDADLDSNEKELSRLRKIAADDHHVGVIVGNEVLLRGDLSSDALIEYIRRVKADQNQPVSYADTWRVWLSHPELANEVDFLMVHIHPYWEGVEVSDAAAYVRDRYHEVQAQYPGKSVIIGETGWPTAGPTVGNAVPSEDNLCRFLRDWYRIATAESIPYFLFEAFDEKWKTDATGLAVESHWGLWDSTRQFKPCVREFRELLATIQITSPGACGAGASTWGTIKGEVAGLSASQRPNYRVVVYAITNQWYVQPWIVSPYAEILDDGRWKTGTHLGWRYAALLWRFDCGREPPATMSSAPVVDGECVIALDIVECTPE